MNSGSPRLGAMASQRRVYGYSGVDKNKAKQNRVTGSGRMKMKEDMGYMES